MDDQTFTLTTLTGTWWDSSTVGAAAWPFFTGAGALMLIFGTIIVWVARSDAADRKSWDRPPHRAPEILLGIASLVTLAVTLVGLWIAPKGEIVVDENSAEMTRQEQYVAATGTIGWVEGRDGDAVDVRFAEDSSVMLKFREDRDRIVGREGAPLAATCSVGEDPEVLIDCDLVSPAEREARFRENTTYSEVPLFGEGRAADEVTTESVPYSG